MFRPQTANLPNPNLFAFTPRQVLLAKSQMKQNKQSDASTKASSLLVLNGALDEPTGQSYEHRTLLLHSVALYLERNGFSKTLKKFMSEALISKDSLKDALLDLEEMCIKYLKTRDHAKTDSNSQKEQAVMEEPGPKHQEKSKRKSKLASESVLDNVKEQGLESLEGEPCKKSEPLLSENEPNKKSSDNKSRKKKVKSELSVDASDHCGVKKENKDRNDLKDFESSRDPKKKSKDLLSENEPNKKSSDNKSRKKKVKSELSVDASDHCGVKKEKKDRKNLKDFESSRDPKKKSKSKKDDELDPNIKDSEINDSRCNGTDLKKDGLKASRVDDGEKNSKKRKKSRSEGHDSKLIDEEAAEGKKRRKVKVLEECLENEHHPQMTKSLKSFTNAGKESGSEGDLVTLKKSQKEPVDLVGEKENGSKSSSKKAMETNDIDSFEPKTINAFQRVKIDEVVFTDKRLQDNSYWAKGGAEIGYGAKAQEVLGQVRGRNFRHEMTKKKRGSYRGGEIDLQSHSVKFSYSEDDE